MNQANCTTCGAGLTLKKGDKTCVCEYCQSTNIVENALALGKVEVDVSEDIKKLRSNLTTFVQQNSIDEILRVSQKLLDWIPQDFVALYLFGYAKQQQNQPRFLYDFYKEPPIHTQTELEVVVEHIIHKSELRDKGRLVGFFELHFPQKLREYVKVHEEREQQENNYANIPRDVFVCFSSYNKEVAERVVEELEADGNTCWISTRNLRPEDADNYWMNIENAIGNSTIFLVISSEESMRSKDVHQEINFARKYNNKLVEFKIDDAPHNTLFKHLFNGIKWVKGSREVNQSFNSLIQRIYDEIEENKESISIYKKYPLKNQNKPRNEKVKFIGLQTNKNNYLKLRNKLFLFMIPILVAISALIITLVNFEFLNPILDTPSDETLISDEVVNSDNELLEIINLNDERLVIIQGNYPNFNVQLQDGSLIEPSNLTIRNPELISKIGIHSVEVFYANEFGQESNLIDIPIHVIRNHEIVKATSLFNESNIGIIDLYPINDNLFASLGSMSVNDSIIHYVSMFDMETKEVLWQKKIQTSSSKFLDISRSQIHQWSNGSIIVTVFNPGNNELLTVNLDLFGNEINRRLFHTQKTLNDENEIFSNPNLQQDEIPGNVSSLSFSEEGLFIITNVYGVYLVELDSNLNFVQKTKIEEQLINYVSHPIKSDFRDNKLSIFGLRKLHQTPLESQNGIFETPFIYIYDKEMDSFEYIQLINSALRSTGNGVRNEDNPWTIAWLSTVYNATNKTFYIGRTHDGENFNYYLGAVQNKSVLFEINVSKQIEDYIQNNTLYQEYNNFTIDDFYYDFLADYLVLTLELNRPYTPGTPWRLGKTLYYSLTGEQLDIMNTPWNLGENFDNVVNVSQKLNGEIVSVYRNEGVVLVQKSE